VDQNRDQKVEVGGCILLMSRLWSSRVIFPLSIFPGKMGDDGGHAVATVKMVAQN
jgi:hypothetical protein